MFKPITKVRLILIGTGYNPSVKVVIFFVRAQKLWASSLCHSLVRNTCVDL